MRDICWTLKTQICNTDQYKTLSLEVSSVCITALLTMDLLYSRHFSFACTVLGVPQICQWQQMGEDGRIIRLHLSIDLWGCWLFLLVWLTPDGLHTTNPHVSPRKGLCKCLVLSVRVSNVFKGSEKGLGQRGWCQWGGELDLRLEVWILRAPLMGKSSGSLLKLWARGQDSLQESHCSHANRRVTQYNTINNPLHRHYGPMCWIIEQLHYTSQNQQFLNNFLRRSVFDSACTNLSCAGASACLFIKYID